MILITDNQVTLFLHDSTLSRRLFNNETRLHILPGRTIPKKTENKTLNHKFDSFFFLFCNVVILRLSEKANMVVLLDTPFFQEKTVSIFRFHHQKGPQMLGASRF